MAVKAKEQNIAVFGESGSGKNVLLSSFFGATQEPSFATGSHYKVVADDTGQGTLLRALHTWGGGWSSPPAMRSMRSR